jgi:hypothetical protein
MWDPQHPPEVRPYPFRNRSLQRYIHPRFDPIPSGTGTYSATATRGSALSLLERKPTALQPPEVRPYPFRNANLQRYSHPTFDAIPSGTLAYSHPIFEPISSGTQAYSSAATPRFYPTLSGTQAYSATATRGSTRLFPKHTLSDNHTEQVSECYAVPTMRFVL